MKWVLLILCVGGLVWWFYPVDELLSTVRDKISPPKVEEPRKKGSALVIRRLKDDIVEIDKKLVMYRADLAELQKPTKSKVKKPANKDFQPDEQFYTYSIARLVDQRAALVKELAALE